jgi:hypothetical protein
MLLSAGCSLLTAAYLTGSLVVLNGGQVVSNLLLRIQKMQILIQLHFLQYLVITTLVGPDPEPH